MPEIRPHNRTVWATGSFHADRHLVIDPRHNGYRRKTSVPVVYAFEENMGEDRRAAEDLARMEMPWLADNECEHGRLSHEGCALGNCRKLYTNENGSKVGREEG